MGNVIPFNPRNGHQIKFGWELRRQFLQMAGKGAVPTEQIHAVAKRVRTCGERAALEFVTALASGQPVAIVLADFGRLTPETYTAVIARINSEWGRA